MLVVILNSRLRLLHRNWLLSMSCTSSSWINVKTIRTSNQTLFLRLISLSYINTWVTKRIIVILIRSCITTTSPTIHFILHFLSKLLTIIILHKLGEYHSINIWNFFLFLCFCRGLSCFGCFRLNSWSTHPRRLINCTSISLWFRLQMWTHWSWHFRIINSNCILWDDWLSAWSADWLGDLLSFDFFSGWNLSTCSTTHVRFRYRTWLACRYSSSWWLFNRSRSWPGINLRMRLTVAVAQLSNSSGRWLLILNTYFRKLMVDLLELIIIKFISHHVLVMFFFLLLFLELNSLIF